MPPLFSLCVEDLGAEAGGQRYLRCVMTGGPELGIDASGEVVWEQQDPAVGLMLDVDGRPCLVRLQESAAVLHRAGRHAELSRWQMTPLTDGDELELAGRRLRFHLHGPASALAAPAPVADAGVPGPRPEPIPVRVHPPAPVVVPDVPRRRRAWRWLLLLPLLLALLAYLAWRRFG